MIKKIVILLSVAFSMIIGVSTISANTSVVKVEVLSRNIEDHTLNVKIEDSDSDEFTLKNVSAAQMNIADKGTIIKATYDDKFNVKSIELMELAAKVKANDDNNDSKAPLIVMLGFVGICFMNLAVAYFVSH